MEPKDFIRKNVQAELEKEGFTSYVASQCSREAASHYGRQAQFQKGKVFDECLKRARSQAKLMTKAGI